MSRLLTRRAVLCVGGAVASVPLATGLGSLPARAAPNISGPLVVLGQPERLFDSRTALRSLGGGKLAVGSSVAVTVVTNVPSGDFITAAFLNVTITETEGSGFLVLRPSDLTGEVPLPMTSNINWSTSGVTLANLVLTGVGGENAVEVHAGGLGGRTHIVVDLQGYVPFVA